jgi:uncharacterized protein YbaR (Trm112 family)
MIDPELLAKLRCPETRQPVRLADAAEVTKLNERIQAGAVSNRGGKTVAEPIDAALVREDRKFAYPIRHDIPLMLLEEAIPLTAV